MEEIVFLDRATIPAQIRVRRPDFPHRWTEYDLTEPADRFERLKEATIVISNKAVLDADLLARLPKLKFIAIAATGTNNVDLAWCRTNRLPVSNVRGYATRSVPEHVIAMMFALRRNLMGYHHDIIRGVWQEKKQFCFFSHPIGDIGGSTLGIIGKGGLGEATANIGKALGMNVLFAEHKGAAACREGYTPLEKVLETADVISLHCPLTESTQNLIATKELGLMKPTALLINAGRGGLVDEQALVEALKNGVIGGAGVDVFTQEPADESNPLIKNADLPNLLLTPHVAWGSDSAIQTLADQLIDNVEAFYRGEPVNLV